jgi:predicted nicotinamide N-methyase
MDHVKWGTPPAVPEIRLRLAGPGAGLFDAGYRSDEPPPFWAFAWPGGQALARYLLDHAAEVAGRRVHDLGCGAGLAAIAAARAGAAAVRAIDSDPDAVAAALDNAAHNGVRIEGVRGELLECGPGDVVLAGDMFYTARVANQLMPVLRRASTAGARVLVGDAGRGFLPAGRFRALAEYDVPVSTVVEGQPIRHTTVWELIARTTGDRA